MKKLRELFSAWADSRIAALEKWAAETRERAKKTPEREYWRGYADGVRDAADHLDAEHTALEEQEAE